MRRGKQVERLRTDPFSYTKNIGLRFGGLVVLNAESVSDKREVDVRVV